MYCRGRCVVDTYKACIVPSVSLVRGRGDHSQKSRDDQQCKCGDQPEPVSPCNTDRDGSRENNTGESEGHLKNEDAVGNTPIQKARQSSEVLDRSSIESSVDPRVDGRVDPS